MSEEPQSIYMKSTYQIFIKTIEEMSVPDVSYFIGARLADFIEKLNEEFKEQSQPFEFFSGEIETGMISYGRGQKIFNKGIKDK